MSSIGAGGPSSKEVTTSWGFAEPAIYMTIFGDRRAAKPSEFPAARQLTKFASASSAVAPILREAGPSETGAASSTSISVPSPTGDATGSAGDATGSAGATQSAAGVPSGVASCADTPGNAIDNMASASPNA